MANKLLCCMLAGLSALVLGFLLVPVQACPFCTMSGSTLTDDVNQASMVLYGTLANPRIDPNGDFGAGSTDLQVEAVVKRHDILGDKKVLVLPKYVPVDRNSKVKFLIFCDVFKGKIDPYKGVPVKTDDIVKYLSGAIALKNQDVSTRLRFFFNWLDNGDIEISNDAYKEFGNTDYKDYREMAKSLPAERIVKWLQDSNTPSFRYGLYASMLGHAGKPEHGAVLRDMLDDPQKRVSSGVDGMLAGYTLLKPKEGWKYVRETLFDESGKLLGHGYGLVAGAPGTSYLKMTAKEFMLRYAALRSARFFWESRPDVIDKKEILPGVLLLLEQNDIADLAIEDLRKWKQWQVLDQVLELNLKPSHNIPIIRRSILRFALSCQDIPKAAQFVLAQRKIDPERVKDVEDLLKLETPTPAPVPAK
jgi:hypothetical protein